jgi:UDP-N-acetylmuramoyl-tripeptide--D-alanyl-D-alanine ligase
MLQIVEYSVVKYLKWFWSVQDFSKVQNRQKLEKTEVSKGIYGLLVLGSVAEIIFGLILFCLGLAGSLAGGVPLGIAIIIAYPVVWSQLVCIPVVLGRIFVINPKQKALIATSKNTFAKHKAIKIVIAGSYGKTTMKETVATILGAGKKVAATPGNKNVSVSHAYYAARLKGDEDILIIELGEGEPGSIKKFAETIKPDIAVITGLSPAHQETYKSIDAAAEDIFTLAKYVKPENLFVNGDSLMAKPYIPKEANIYTTNGVLSWKAGKAKVSMDGVTFDLTNGKKQLKLKSHLMGRHQIGPIVLGAALANKLGLTDKQIIDGVEKTKPFKHRMQPYMLNDAWIIDDTYNGNTEGIRVGTELLAELPGKRKIYVTPGIVEQGKESDSIHKELGKVIARSQPDIVVLMQNSATSHIEAGLKEGGFNGQLKIEADPVKFYSNLDSFVAKGDVVMMQNDWADKYK